MRILILIFLPIELTPNLTSLWVKGIEKFFFTVTEETNFIVFHSTGIDISSRTINERLKVRINMRLQKIGTVHLKKINIIIIINCVFIIQVERMLEFPSREQVYLETDEYMVPGVTYALRLKFSYMLSNHLEGFYFSEYFDKAGNKRRIASTHFEPTYARRAFPCFDEPHLKAKFLMTITHDRLGKNIISIILHFFLQLMLYFCILKLLFFP